MKYFSRYLFIYSTDVKLISVSFKYTTSDKLCTLLFLHFIQTHNPVYLSFS